MSLAGGSRPLTAVSQSICLSSRFRMVIAVTTTSAASAVWHAFAPQRARRASISAMAALSSFASRMWTLRPLRASLALVVDGGAESLGFLDGGICISEGVCDLEEEEDDR